MLLNRDSILKASDLKTIDVDVPEWGGAVRIRTMTGADREMYFRAARDKEGNPRNSFAALIAATVVDDNGNLIFKEKDVEELNKKNGAVLGRLWDKAAELNGLTQASVDAIAGE